MSAKHDLEPILIIEDSESEAFLLKRALQRAQVTGRIIRLVNGLEAMKYLRGTPPYNDREQYPVPALIFTDLQMPVMDGFEVLAAVRIHVQCCAIPIIVMSNSKDQIDIYKAYQLGANSYIVKPQSLDELVRIVGIAIQYWTLCRNPVGHA